MTVQQLIRKLQECDPEAIVYVNLTMEEVTSLTEDEDDDGPFVAIEASPIQIHDPTT